jgi:hypothetical protein
MPATAGETLSGQHVKPSDLVKGHTAVLIAGFSHEAGMHSGAWRKAVTSDPAMQGVLVLELAMLEKAPGLIRGMIKSGMRKDVSPPGQDRIVVMTQDQTRWEKFFGVSDDKVPYVILLNERGDVVWSGHGQAAELEPELRKALAKR